MEVNLFCRSDFSVKKVKLFSRFFCRCNERTRSNELQVTCHDVSQ